MGTSVDRLRLLHRLGFEPAEADALMLVPLVEVAWADGVIQREEADHLARSAHQWGIGAEGRRMLAGWLEFSPTPGYCSAALELVAAGLPDPRRLPDLLAEARAVAAAAGGWFSRICRAERETLVRIGAALEGRGDAPDPHPDLRRVSPAVTLAFEGDDLELEPQRAVLVPQFPAPRVPLPLRGPLVVGSAPFAQVRIEGDPQIAPTHCEIASTGPGRYVVRDLHGPHGTRVNGERVRERRLLGGETLRLSDATSFLFKKVRRYPVRLFA